MVLKRTKLFLLLSLFIFVLAVFFHRPIRIVDALTSLPVEGFDIRISPVRILFEPVLGPLLFYLRADQPVVEFAILLLWMMTGMLLLDLFRERRSEEPQFRRAVVLWALKSPVLVIVFIALMLFLIFAPLPTNRIVNRLSDTILVNFHSHTYFSHDGLASPLESIRWHGYNGFDAFFITEHNHHNTTLRIIDEQTAGRLPAAPVILCGQEYSGTNHLLLLGLTRDFRTKDMPDETAVDSAHAQNGVAIVAHWFADKRRPIQHYIDCGVDGFEITNQAEGISYDRGDFDDISANCRTNGLIMTGACDWHGYGNACLTWNALTIPGWRELTAEQQRQSILDILRNRDQERLSVLLYRDRTVFDRENVLLSPVYSFIEYFRGLKRWQLLSWYIWLTLAVGIGYFAVHPGTAGNSLKVCGIWGMVSSISVLTAGIVLLVLAGSLTDYNEIFPEYGRYFLWGGLVFALYSLFLLFAEKIKRSCLLQKKE